MLSLEDQLETIQNFTGASTEEKFELLLLFSAVNITFIISPILYVLTDGLVFPAVGVLFGFLDVVLSQYLPPKLQTKDESESA